MKATVKCKCSEFVMKWWVNVSKFPCAVSQQSQANPEPQMNRHLDCAGLHEHNCGSLWSFCLTVWVFMWFHQALLFDINKMSSLPLAPSVRWGTGHYFYSAYLFASTFKPPSWWLCFMHLRPFALCKYWQHAKLLMFPPSTPACCIISTHYFSIQKNTGQQSKTNVSSLSS